MGRCPQKQSKESSGSAERGPGTVHPSREGGQEPTAGQVTALCGYDRKYAIKVLNMKRPIRGSRQRLGDLKSIYGEAECKVFK